MNNLDDICIWKITADDPTSTTFKNLGEEHKFYKCVIGDGQRYCCPDYVSVNSIKDKEESGGREQ